MTSLTSEGDLLLCSRTRGRVCCCCCERTWVKSRETAKWLEVLTVLKFCCNVNYLLHLVPQRSLSWQSNSLVSLFRVAFFLPELNSAFSKMGSVQPPAHHSPVQKLSVCTNKSNHSLVLSFSILYFIPISSSVFHQDLHLIHQSPWGKKQNNTLRMTVNSLLCSCAPISVKLPHHSTDSASCQWS